MLLMGNTQEPKQTRKQKLKRNLNNPWKPGASNSSQAQNVSLQHNNACGFWLRYYQFNFFYSLLA